VRERIERNFPEWKPTRKSLKLGEEEFCRPKGVEGGLDLISVKMKTIEGNFLRKINEF
jgi:hypothetical protein